MIERAKDVYTWAAVTDDSCIGEYDRDDGLGFAGVDGTQVKHIKLESSDPRLHSHYVDIPHGATPIFFRRRSIEINLVQETSTPRPTVHCIGWKRGDEATYLFVFDDGSTLLTDDLQAV